MTNVSKRIFEQLFAASRESLVVVEIDNQDPAILYVNPAFEKLTGYHYDEIRGRNCRLLLKDDLEQEALATLRVAVDRRNTAEVLLRNYRKDGSLFWNLLKIVPLEARQGHREYYAGFLQDVTDQVRARRIAGEHGLPDVAGGDTQHSVKYDKLTGLYARPYFEEMSQRDWDIARRDGKSVSALIASVDFFAQYQDTFGLQATDSGLRLVAHAIAGSLRRASDLYGRYSEREFAAVFLGMGTEEAISFGEMLRERVAELCMHHPRSAISKYVTVSIGVCTHTPGDDNTLQDLFDAARIALRSAQECGRDRVAGGDLRSHRKTA